jgi:hypothetical protein
MDFPITHLMDRDACIAWMGKYFQREGLKCPHWGAVLSSLLSCVYTSSEHEPSLYLHVVCEYADPVYTEIVTAYIPDESEWERPPFRRHRR